MQQIMAKQDGRRRKTYMPPDFGSAKLIAVPPEIVTKAPRRVRDQLESMAMRQADSALVGVGSRSPVEGHFRHVRVLEQTNLDRLFCRGNISHDEHRAGERLRSLYFKANIDRGVVSDWRKYLATSRSTKTEGDNYDAREEFLAAITSVGRANADILFWFVLQDMTARDAAKKLGYDHRHGVGVARVALRALVEHFRV